MTKQDVESAIAKHGSRNAAAKALGISRRKVRSILGPAVHDRPSVARSLSDFRAQYDKATIIPARVKAALRSIGAGWAYEVDFAKQAGVSLADLGRFRDQFASHVVQIGRDSRRAWAGTPATAKAMREMLE